MSKKIILTKDQDEFLRENIKGKTRVEVTLLINKAFGSNFKASQIDAYCRRKSIKSGLDCRFKKGQIPANKGKKMSQEQKDKIKHTFFKKGNIPQNYKPVGSERINVYGYTEIKIEDPNVWVLKHRLIYEKEVGQIPKDCTVLFLDGNKQNFDIENLALVQRRELVRLNQKHLISDDKDITKAELNCIKLSYAVSDAKKKRSDNNAKSRTSEGITI